MGDTSVKPAVQSRAGTSPWSDDALEAGSRVEVRRRFDRSWARGFEVAEPVEGGYRIRRLSDGMVLPAEFAPDEVRPARDMGPFFWGG